MAKRRKLEAPSKEEMSKLEEAFRRETPISRSSAPIAQVAAESAANFSAQDPDLRAAQIANEQDAQAFRAAQDAGRLILEIQIDEIDPEPIPRDRTTIDRDAQAELEHSIKAGGLRLPIEVYALPQRTGPFRYGLISGYRRLLAQRALSGQPGGGTFSTIKALLRQTEALGSAFSAMVEENEVRENLSHYERGRIAVIAAQQGGFGSTEQAVDAMFPAASKAKRSKIRSFAFVFEELGDLLSFPEQIREKEGLKLAALLRSEAGKELRAAFEMTAATTPEQERKLILGILAKASAPSVDPKRGGRPKRSVPSTKWVDEDTLQLQDGVTLARQKDAAGWFIRIGGVDLDREAMADLMVKMSEVEGLTKRQGK